MTGQGSQNRPHDAPEASGQSSLFAELRKRHVYRAAIAYAVVAWGLTEILEGVISRLGWWDWLATLIVIIFVVGFPVAMFLAWVFDWTPEGIRRTERWTAAGWLSVAMAITFLVVGTAGLFWLINPSGVARSEQTGIAVLPCRYRGAPSFAFRGEGFAELVHERLAHSARLFVPEFAAVVSSSAAKLPTSELADRLGVLWLVECRVVEEDGRFRIESALIHLATDESEPLASLEVDSAALPGALESLVQAIVGRLGLAMSLDGSGSLSERFPSSIRALDAYLRGEQALRVGTTDSVTTARAEFKAAQLVPGFYLARIREADALMASIELEPPIDAAELEAALRAAKLMLAELDIEAPRSAALYASHLHLANVSDRYGSDESTDPDQRREWFERAIALKPSDAEPYLLYADYLSRGGNQEDAAELTAKAESLSGPGLP